jgi:hypothetical protein
VNSTKQVDLRGIFGGKAARWFVISTGIILLITGASKIFSAFGKVEILNLSDPIFRISFGHLMLFVGVLELIISMVCLFADKQKISLSLVAWAATSFFIYRISLWCIGWHHPCSCLGNMTDALHISAQTADFIMRLILIYLLFGSYTFLLGTWYKDIRISKEIIL